MTQGGGQPFEAVLVRQCAPTLAGIKAGSIFCFRAASLETADQKVRQWDERLAPFGLSVRVLCQQPASGSLMIYVYRRSHLERMLSEGPCRDFLESVGYRAADWEGLLGQLACRLQRQGEFPHEIGLFLGYPLQDVIGFIQNRGRNFTCCGFWKSYGDPEEMQARFARCRSCIRAYTSLYEQGVPIEKLAVPA